MEHKEYSGAFLKQQFFFGFAALIEYIYRWQGDQFFSAHFKSAEEEK